jgi:hypothetical protein
MLQSKFMGVQYQLVNMTKRECISFTHMDGTKMKELAGNPAQASIVTWYLLNNQGDNIQFISDTYNEWPFNIGKRGDESGFKDVTMKYIDILIGQKILRNDGMLYVDEEEPDNIYIFNLKNIWLE